MLHILVAEHRLSLADLVYDCPQGSVKGTSPDALGTECQKGILEGYLYVTDEVFGWSRAIASHQKGKTPTSLSLDSLWRWRRDWRSTFVQPEDIGA